MAIFNGTLLIFKHGNIAIGHSTKATMTLTESLEDATTKDSSGWNDHMIGARGGTIDVEALMDYSASSGVDELADLIVNRKSASFEFGTGITGDTKWTGTVSLGSLTMDAGKETPATFSGNMTIKGAPTKSVY